jgi:hypothetical protein
VPGFWPREHSARTSGLFRRLSKGSLERFVLRSVEGWLG